MIWHRDDTGDTQEEGGEEREAGEETTSSWKDEDRDPIPTFRPVEIESCLGEIFPLQILVFKDLLFSSSGPVSPLGSLKLVLPPHLH